MPEPQDSRGEESDSSAPAAVVESSVAQSDTSTDGQPDVGSADAGSGSEPVAAGAQEWPTEDRDESGPVGEGSTEVTGKADAEAETFWPETEAEAPGDGTDADVQEEWPPEQPATPGFPTVDADGAAEPAAADGEAASPGSDGTEEPTAPVEDRDTESQAEAAAPVVAQAPAAVEPSAALEESQSDPSAEATSAEAADAETGARELAADPAAAEPAPATDIPDTADPDAESAPVAVQASAQQADVPAEASEQDAADRVRGGSTTDSEPEAAVGAEPERAEEADPAPAAEAESEPGAEAAPERAEPEAATEPEPEPAAEPEVVAESAPAPEAAAEPDEAVGPEPERVPEVAVEPELAAEPVAEPEPERAEPETVAEPEQAVGPEPERVPEVAVEPEPAAQPEPTPEPVDEGTAPEPEPATERTQFIPVVRPEAPDEVEAEQTRMLPKLDFTPDAPVDKAPPDQVRATEEDVDPAEVERAEFHRPVRDVPEVNEVEQTQVIPLVPLSEPPRESESERTQFIPRIDSAQQTTQRHPAPPPRPAPADPPTTRLPVVPHAVESPTTQIPFPNLSGPPDIPAVSGRPTEAVAAPTRPDPPQRVAASPGRRRGTAVLLAAVSLVVAGAGVGAWALWDTGRTQIAAAPPPVRLQPAIRPVDGTGSIPTAGALAGVLSPVAADPALGTFAGSVVDAATGKTLWQQNAEDALIPASTGKLLTTGAALLALDHQHRFTTKVVQGATPGQVVVLAGGDPTLSSLPAGKESVYPGAGRLDDLVAQVKAATGGQVDSIVLDTSRYSGPSSAPGWLPEDVAAGFVAPIEPVMLDGGRVDPTQLNSPRSTSPALDMGHELASRLGVPESAVEIGDARRQGRVLGQVQSATVRDMVETVLLHSDNVLAEALAREVAHETGRPASFEGASAAAREVLADNGIDLSSSVMVDGSGLSINNRVTPKLLASLLAAATASAGPEGGLPESSAKLRALLPGLPVGGGSGSLEDRYEDGAAGRGWVRAKTGTLSDANSLAGTVVTEDNRLLVFAFMSNGTGSGAARPALDAVAGTLRGCGC